jgi:hypothetical protein
LSLDPQNGPFGFGEDAGHILQAVLENFPDGRAAAIADAPPDHEGRRLMDEAQVMEIALLGDE